MTAGVSLTAVALVVLALIVAWWARRPTEAVRLRNALRLERSSARDFDWRPPDYPAGFALERRAPSADFRRIVDSLGIAAIATDWDKALALAGHLTEHAADKGPIRADLAATYRAIRDGRGYCADFVKVYLALAQAAGLPVRRWAFSFDGFGGHGHTVVEVFDRQRARWLLLDIYNNFHAVDAGSGEPLGALEYREALLGQRGEARMRRSGPGRPGFVHEHKALEYYRRGVDQWYLMWGNAVYSYDAHPLVRWAGRVSPTLADVAANLVGAHPSIRIYPTSHNGDALRRMFALRRRLRWAGMAAIVLLVALVLQLVAGSAAGRAVA